jgi:hypothetical protein
MNHLNVIVDNGSILPSDKEILFEEEDVIVVPPDTTMFDLLVMLGSFPSKSQARKNWKAGGEIPIGWSEFFVGKKKRHLCIWNPSEET